MRFDDNPEAEKKEYIDHIKEIVQWMGWESFKGGPLSPVTPNTIRKAGFILSLKLKKEQSNSTILSTKSFLRRPIAGSQVPLSPVEKKVFNSWSHIEPGSFKVRAENYLRDKKKGFPQNHAAYYPFGADVFLSQKKVDHIARFVELPLTSLYGKFPPLLVVNVQIPLYSPSLFQSENEGEGMSVVLYFRLSESYSKEIAPHFLENLRIRAVLNELLLNISLRVYNWIVRFIALAFPPALLLASAVNSHLARTFQCTPSARMTGAASTVLFL